MISAPILDMTGKELGTYEFDPAELAPGINKQLLHDAVVMYQANQRQGTSATKSRNWVKAAPGTCGLAQQSHTSTIY